MTGSAARLDPLADRITVFFATKIEERNLFRARVVSRQPAG